MNKHWHEHLLARLERGDSLEQIEVDLGHIPGLTEEERAALWLLAWGESERRAPGSVPPRPALESASGRSARLSDRSPSGRSGHRHDVIVSTLDLARRGTGMDVAVLAEVRDGLEVARLLSGDGISFGLSRGASMPIEDTYCGRLLEGRISNFVPNTKTDEVVRDLELTRQARIGAYIGVPLTTLEARLYVLCCLAHEQQPSLSERDVVFLRGLCETLSVELAATAADY
jgi:GAF domain-containing protein